MLSLPRDTNVGANNVLVVHTAGEVTNRSRFHVFEAHRARFNREMQMKAAPVTEAYSKVRTMQSRQDRKQVVTWVPDANSARCRCDQRPTRLAVPGCPRPPYHARVASRRPIY